MQDTAKKTPKDGIEGEGSYSGTRDYNERTAKFIDKGKVDKAAREARRAMDSDEAAELTRHYRRGEGLDWIMRHRIAGLEAARLVRQVGPRLVLTARLGWAVAWIYRLTIAVLGLKTTG